MSAVSTATAPTADRPATVDRFTRVYTLATLGLTALSMVVQAVASRGDDDIDVRESWLSDVVAVAVASLLFAAIAYFVARRAIQGDARRQARTVIGLTIFAVVLAPLGWWSAGPMLVALAAILLGRMTGATDRNTGSSGARTAGIVAILVAVGLFAFVNVVVALEQL
jgi:hypothetical protein